MVKTLWPIGFSCPRCGRRDRITAPKSRIEGRYCGHCNVVHPIRAQLVVTNSTVPMTKVLRAVLLLTEPPPITDLQLSRALPVTFSTATRLRERLTSGHDLDELAGMSLDDRLRAVLPLRRRRG